MPLNSTSSPQDILAAYADNADWFVEESEAKANRFIVACDLLLGLRPEQTNVDGTSSQHNSARIEQQKREAAEWLKMRRRSSRGSASRRWDMRGLRS